MATFLIKSNYNAAQMYYDSLTRPDLSTSTRSWFFRGSYWWQYCPWWKKTAMCRTQKTSRLISRQSACIVIKSSRFTNFGRRNSYSIRQLVSNPFLKTCRPNKILLEEWLQPGIRRVWPKVCEGLFVNKGHKIQL